MTDAILHAAAEAMLDTIASVMGCLAPPLTISREVANAAANEYAIAVNPDWLHEQMSFVCADAQCHHDLLLGTLAHELSHVVHRDAFAPEWTRQLNELRADEFAGAALGRLNVSPDAFAAVVWNLSGHYPDRHASHPDRHRRVEAVTAGYWYAVGEQDALRFYGLAA